MEIFVIAILIGLIPAAIASGKGRSFVGWWIYGALLFIIALPHSLIMTPNRPAVERQAIAAGDSKKCPRCAELVKAEAQVCRFCRHEFDRAPARA